MRGAGEGTEGHRGASAGALEQKPVKTCHAGAKLISIYKN